ncbi:hypothetical protein EST38_g6381 [Candolleomyces aberdarensis]|uniref:DUF3669 domain-containing protein n=1 Tax=Candolleomyces aberdarensis TaxID=2316362 RepID=A0A4Q2DHY5_9AGAR|nr:hypothetical protein EST38_g6381 [Candolleomyces aberdarensis]
MSNPSENTDLISKGFTRLSRGSFAEVYAKGNVAFKRFTRGTSETQRQEFNFLVNMHNAFQTTTSHFRVPTPIAFHMDERNHVTHDPSVNVKEDMDEISATSIAMERLHPIPEAVSGAILEMYFPEKKDNGPGIKLCKICLGQEPEPKPTKPDSKRRKFVITPSLDNFSLSANKYATLAEMFPGQLVPLHEVARSMGERLAQLHFIVKVVPNDVEFVMSRAQSGDPSKVGYYIIDFGLVKPWTLADGFKVLVDSFFERNLWYPRPVPDEVLYEAFKDGYKDSCPNPGYAAEFLQGIEDRQLIPTYDSEDEYTESPEEEETGGTAGEEEQEKKNLKNKRLHV